MSIISINGSPRKATALEQAEIDKAEVAYAAGAIHRAAKKEIVSLENTINSRRLREAITTPNRVIDVVTGQTAAGWILDVERQISVQGLLLV